MRKTNRFGKRAGTARRAVENQASSRRLNSLRQDRSSRNKRKDQTGGESRSSEPVLRFEKPISSLRESQRLRQPYRSHQNDRESSGIESHSSHPQTSLARPSRFRLVLVWSILIAGGLVLMANVFDLQVVRSNQLQQMARTQQQSPMPAFVPRRPIVDRQNNILAVDRPVYSLYAHPTLFRLSHEDIATELAPILKRPVDELVKELYSGPSGIRLTDFLSEATAGEIQRKWIDGLEFVHHSARHYPRSESVAEVVGYVNFDGEGQAGVELNHQDELKRSIEEISLVDEEIGPIDRSARHFFQLDDLRLKLTIDSRLQRLVRPVLNEGVSKWGAKRGTVMVMDVRDGSLLCLVNTPSFDPNRYFDADLASLKNWALTDLYEPGSTFKPINVAIALETGAIQPNSSFYDPGQIFVDGWPIGNAGRGGFGQIDVAEIISVSSNVGMVRIMEQMSASDYYDWLEKLGLGETSQIDLPFEIPGQLKSREQFVGSPVEAATTAFGQGFAISPIQMLRLQATLANGGKLVVPHTVDGLFDSEERPHWQPDLPPPRQVFSPETAGSVLEMMEQTVESGTGQGAYIPGYRIAGKTGTAQKSTAGGGYSDSAIVTSFVGILPVESPRYVVLAVVDEPNGGSGGEVAAPIVKSVMEILIGIEGIPPAELE
ncbi:penicillin-binding protein 2 [Oscillatoriales cyanobacterium LEGE 11467]|uniref:Penicillin-binding protein 2 n=1 Tax=Zarconia navalis LEGE 11467 TaxID=1828826 RepID=A0A928VVU1_9CYAN|nr:penicillin-binding protein 2 [Zarconia navalis]MBE9041091.1 penicillin-binding protein 2 [Zarconia navalis LEGE 11467]